MFVTLMRYASGSEKTVEEKSYITIYRHYEVTVQYSTENGIISLM